MDQAHSSKLLSHCPLCQATYHQEEIRLLGEKGSTRLFHCTCQSCGHAMLALILETQGAVSSVGLVTDLEAGDALRFRDRDPISEDDCIAAHHAMECESTELCRLLVSSPLR